MQKYILTSFLFLSFMTQAFAQSQCMDLMRSFIKEEKTKDESPLKKDILSLGLSEEKALNILGHLKLKKEPVDPIELKNYLLYVLTLNKNDQDIALLDLAQLGEREEYSPFIKKFREKEASIQKKMDANPEWNLAQQERYRELFYGCRAITPNDVNKNAARDFKRFALTLGLSTMTASYVYFNMDKDINGEWFAKLGVELSVNLLYTYLTSVIQTNPNDTQLSKSIKSYFIGRASGLTDFFIYDPLFNHEREKAQQKINELKKNPLHKEEIDALLKSYEERGLYRKYKEEIIKNLKMIPGKIGLGLKGPSVDENNIDWNNLTQKDLDNPVVQDVLVAAAMAQAYQQNKGEWIETSDSGLDRYTFNSVFFALQIPRNMAQSFLTYQMLCMGQDTPKLAFTKAVLFNVTSNFLINQALYKYREIAVGK